METPTISNKNFLKICLGLRSWAKRGRSHRAIDDCILLALPESKRDPIVLESLKSAWANCRDSREKFAAALAGITGCNVEFAEHIYPPRPGR